VIDVDILVKSSCVQNFQCFALVINMKTLKTYKLRGELKDPDEADEDKKFHFK
jgi:hypothetical protein